MCGLFSLSCKMSL